MFVRSRSLLGGNARAFSTSAVRLKPSQVVQRTSPSLSPSPPVSLAKAKQKPPRKTANPLVRIVDGFKTFKPITPGLRHVRLPVAPHLWKGSPVRALTTPIRKKGGRNSTGRITVRSRGGGHKRRLREMDFYRWATGPHDVIRIEYDPNRSAHIALVKSRNPSAEQPYSYILACDGLRAGGVIESWRKGIPEGLIEGYVDVKGKEAAKRAAENRQDSLTQLSLGLLRNRTVNPGNVLPLRLIPPGTTIHAISLKITGPAQLVRSAGTSATIVLHDAKGEYTQVRLQSGEERWIGQECCATIGKVSNSDWKGRVLGKAGRSRWLGRRPHVRGVAMNACVSLTHPLAHQIWTDHVLSIDATIPMAVDEASLRVTSIHNPLGASTPRVSEHANLERRATRRVTRWWLRSGQEAGRCSRPSYDDLYNLGRHVPLVYRCLSSLSP
jgi:ribosomal protein L2